jgi:hypothetical protein
MIIIGETVDGCLINRFIKNVDCMIGKDLGRIHGPGQTFMGILMVFGTTVEADCLLSLICIPTRPYTPSSATLPFGGFSAIVPRLLVRKGSSRYLCSWLGDRRKLKKIIHDILRESNLC